MKKVDEFITPARLKSERFWTDKMISEHLGEPDRLVPNPNYRSGPEMRLYDFKRVLRTERRKKVAEALNKVSERREARSHSAKISALNRRETLIKHELSQIETQFEGISFPRLVQLGMEGKDMYGGADDDTKFRWAVNCARHELTTYDGVRVMNSGCVGVHAAAEAVRNEVLDRIAKTWPQLRAECDRQKR